MTNPKPLVTVVIPTHNRARLVGRAIRSILDQTDQRFHIIVVDDCSTDNTVAVVRTAGGERVQVLEHQVNKGASGARNTGIDAATTPYVAFLDSDDSWRPHKLAKQLAAAEAKGWPEDFVVYGKGLGHSTYGETIHSRRAKEPGESWVDYQFSELTVFNPSCLLMSTKLARDVRFDERLPRFNHPDFALRTTDVTDNVEFIDEILYDNYYYEDDAHVSTLNCHEFILNWIDNQDREIQPEHMARILRNNVVHSACVRRDARALVRAVELGYRPPYISPADIARHALIFAGGTEGYRRVRDLVRRVRGQKIQTGPTRDAGV